MAINYFFFYAGFGVFLPFFSPYLASLGFSKAQIGLIYTSFSFFAVFAPLAGRLSDKRLGPARTLKIFAVGLVVSLVAITFVLPKAGFAFLLGLWAYALLRAPIGSLQDTIAMSIAGEQPRKYSHMRVVGSIGFAITSWFCGYFFDHFGIERFFPALLIMSIPFLIFTLRLRDPEWIPETALNKSFWQDLSPSWWWWLSAMVLHWFCFAPFHYGFTFLLSEQGVAKSWQGAVWSVGVFAEILVFLFSGSLFKRWTYRQLLFVAFFANLFRWLILGFHPAPGLIWATQILHGLGFALFYTSALQGIAKYHGGRYRASYQALFATSIAFFSNIFGISLAGQLHQHLSMSQVYLCFVPVQVIALWILKKNPLVTFAERSTQSRFHDSMVRPSEFIE
ncbi:MAG: MFS transporter [Acidobacteria bacterium]|nr:MFS transporter [Acidobacteriota bacterium]MCB9396999.1 MFS transporter [Acidobacteriota bacterium]